MERGAKKFYSGREYYLESYFLIFLLVFGMIADIPFAFAFSGLGAGTIANPYNITNCTQLQEMNLNLTSNYSLVNNINFNTDPGCSSYTAGSGWLPVGNSSYPFIGTFFGNDFTVSNLFINRSSQNYVGLFGYSDPGRFYDIRLDNADVKGQNFAGVLIGKAQNTYVDNCYSIGSVQGADAVGGLIGSASVATTINNSHSSGTVISSMPPTLNSNAGGLVGWADSLEVYDSYSNADVNGGGHRAGGLIGFLSGGKIDNSYANGTIFGSGAFVGGLLGYGTNSLMINNSYATGNVNGSGEYTGGLVGYFYDSTVDNSYATGNATGSNVVGGLLGYAEDGTVRNSYATGNVTTMTSNAGGLIGMAKQMTLINNSNATGNVNGNSFIGGLIGKDIESSTIKNSHAFGNVTSSGTKAGGLMGYARNSMVDNCYTAGATTGSNDVGGLIGYSYSGLNLDNSYATGNVNGTNNVGGLIGVDYSGTINNSYSTGNVFGASYVGGLVGYTYGSTVDNLYATGDVTGTNDYVGGLVGHADSSTKISNSNANGTVRGVGYYYYYAWVDNSYIGGLAGYVSGTIESSYATGDVYSGGYGGGSNFGGLVGLSSGTINNSYSTGNVQGTNDSNVGGLVGRVYYATIDNSYAIGNVNGTDYVGGFIGRGFMSTITNSFSIGSVNGTNSVGGFAGYDLSVATIDNCYWNNNSGNPDECLGGGSAPGSCTAIDNNQAYFYDILNSPMNVWDFVNIWDNIFNHADFPVLQFQNASDITPPIVVSVSSDNQGYNYEIPSPASIIVTFSEDITLMPTIEVSPDGGTQTVDDCLDGDDKTFCFSYSLPLVNWITETINISGAQDAVPNTMVEDISHTFNVDTITPLVTILATDSLINTADNGTILNISAAYDELMNISITPSISSYLIDMGVLVFVSGSWNATNTTYTASYSINADIGESMQDNDVSISGGYDLAGNLQSMDPFTEQDILDVDTMPPMVTCYTLPDPAKAGLVRINISFSEPMNLSASPNVSIMGLTSSYLVVQSSFSAPGEWRGNFTLLDDDEETTANISVSFGQDSAGNIMLPDSSWTFGVDSITPTLTSISIASNNTNPDFAKIGDLVTLSLSASESITGGLAVNINGGAATIASLGGNNYTATRVMQSGDAEGNITFAINFNDTARNAGMQVSTITTGNNILFDKTTPTIGNISNITVYTNASISYNLNISDALAGIASVSTGNTNFTINNSGFLTNATTFTSDKTYTLTIIAVDNVGNNGRVVIVVTILDSTDTLATNSTTTLTNSSTEIIFNSQSSNVTDIIIPSDIPENSPVILDLSALVNASYQVELQNNLTLSRIGETYNYSAYISAGTIMTGSSNWSGEITMPTVISGITISGGTVDAAISLGTNEEINFSAPIKVVIGGMAGKKAAWARGSTSLIDITTQCTNINGGGIVAGRECYIDSGNDLIIWTYHFTSFAAYTATTTTTNTTNDDTEGGSVSGGDAYWITPYYPTDAQLKAGYTQSLSLKFRMRVKVGTELHYVGVVGLTSTTATINVSSITQQSVMNIGDIKKFDVTNDSYYDLSVKLNSIASSKANITITSIHEQIPATAPAPVVTPGTPEVPSGREQVTNVTGGAGGETSLTLIFGVILAIILVAIAIIFILRKGKKRKHSWEHHFKTY
jgi:hypothetical protein